MTQTSSSLLVATGRECVGLRVGRDEQARRRHVRPAGDLGQILAQPVELAGGDLGGACRLDGELVRRPVRGADDAEAEQEADDESGHPTEHRADEHHETGEAGEQDDSLEGVRGVHVQLSANDGRFAEGLSATPLPGSLAPPTSSLCSGLGVLTTDLEGYSPSVGRNVSTSSKNPTPSPRIPDVTPSGAVWR